MEEIIFKNVSDINLDHVFQSGQTFRWEKLNDSSYKGIVKDKFCIASLYGTDLILNVSDGDRQFWHNYFDLGANYSDFKYRLLTNDSKIETALKNGYGIRILRQDFFEVLITFIISQNNNIPRITKLVKALSVKYGEYLGEFFGESAYAFPTPESLAAADAEDLKEMKFGYRSTYIPKAAEQFLKQGIPEGTILEQTLIIESYTGVGPKVRSCITLFGLHDMESFPIDTWVKKIMSDMYGFKSNEIKKMQDFAEKRFGDIAGLAQQYLFFDYMRKSYKI